MSTAKGLHSSRLHLQFAVALALAFVIIAFVAQPLTIAASGVAPLTLVKQLVAQVLSAVKDKRMTQPDKQTKLRELGAANFDFDEMSRLAMGRSWRSLSADQRKRFVPVFTSFLEDAYLNKVQNYSDQKIQITKAHVTDKDYAQVSGHIVQRGSEPIGLGFSLKREGGTWKIYDVAVDNVSTLDSYRTEFQRIMSEKGFDELMAQIPAARPRVGIDAGQPHRPALLEREIRRNSLSSVQRLALQGPSDRAEAAESGYFAERAGESA